MTDPVHVVRLLGGVASTRQLTAHTTRHSLHRAVADGRLVRPGRGVYALPDLPAPYRSAAAVRGVLSHESAAEHWRMEAIAPPASVHVCVPREARPVSPRGVTVHWQRLGHHEVVGCATSPLRTVLDCAATLPFDHALAIADSALRRELVDPDALLDAAVHCRGQGRARRLRVVEAADGRADNPFESALRAILLQHGVTGFEPQLQIRDGDWAARVDLGDRARRIVLEADSFAHHGTRDALVRDCRRYDELVIRGWLVLRFAWEHVMLQPDWVAGVVIESVALRGGRRTNLPNHASRPRSADNGGLGRS